MSHVTGQNRISRHAYATHTEKPIYSHSVSSPEFFVASAAPHNPFTSLPSISDANWGHYIDVTTAAEDLDRRIDLYRQKRNSKI